MVPVGEGRRGAFFNICGITEYHRAIASSRLRCPVVTTPDTPVMDFSVRGGEVKGGYVAHTHYQYIKPVAGSASEILGLLRTIYPNIPRDKEYHKVDIEPWWDRDKTPR
jgi:hypothetical protein